MAADAHEIDARGSEAGVTDGDHTASSGGGIRIEVSFLDPKER